MSSIMTFQSLHLERAQYGAHVGHLVGRVRANYSDTSLEVKLPDAVIVQLMSILGPLLADQVALSLQAVLSDHEAFVAGEAAKQIEQPPSDR